MIIGLSVFLFPMNRLHFFYRTIIFFGHIILHKISIQHLFIGKWDDPHNKYLGVRY